MAISQISRIQVRRGPKDFLPSGTPENPVSLLEGEIGLTVDDGQLFIGTPNLGKIENRKPGIVPQGTMENEKGQTEKGRFPYANTQILTEFSRNTEELINYVYRNRDLIHNKSFPGPGEGFDWTYDQASPWDENNEIVTRHLQERLDDIVSVKAYGAKGDGVTDDTYAFWRAACDVVRINKTQYSSDDVYKTTSRKILYIPAGTYKITRSLILPPYSTWVGDGIDKTIIKLMYASTDFKSRCVVETTDDSYCSSEGLEILQQCWASDNPADQVLVHTEYQIGNANKFTTGLSGTELPDHLMCCNLTLEHAGTDGGAKPSRDILRLNRSSKTLWHNVHFKGSNYKKNTFYNYIPRSIISEIVVTHVGVGYTYDTTEIKIIGNGFGASARPVIENGNVTAIEIINQGSGYTNASIEINNINGGSGYGAQAIALTTSINFDYSAIDETGRAMYNSGEGNPYLTNSIGVFIDGLGGSENGAIVNPHDHIFDNCIFSGTTYGFSMTDQVQNVVINNCIFEEMYRAISIGENLWWYNFSYDKNLPSSGTIASLPDEIKNNIVTGHRLLLLNQDDTTRNNKVYIINLDGSNYSLIELKTFGLHTNADIGDALLKNSFGGPSNIKISNCNFRKIIESAIFVEKGRGILSTNNSFEQTVGKGYAAGWANETTTLPIIYFGGNSENCSSLNDWFSRKDQEITSDPKTRRILYNPLGGSMIVDFQEPMQIPKSISGNITIPLLKTTPLTARPQDNPNDYFPPGLPIVDPFPSQNQLISEFKNTGIELPISMLVKDGPVVTEVVGEEGFVIDYIISGKESRCLGKLQILSKFNPYPEKSLVSMIDTKIVNINDPAVRFVAVIKKLIGDKTYINILYNNAYGTEDTYNFTFNVRKWKV